MSAPLVLVTGATGYVASHVIQVLLKNDYRVRGTVRNLQDKKKYAHLKDLSPDYERNPVDLVQADLLKDDGWGASVEGCQYVIHIAAPFPAEMPSDEEELIRPTVDGTMRLLKACAKEAHKGLLKRVVMLHHISSICGEPVENCGRIYNEDDWTDINSPLLDATAKAKTMAERKAWDFMKSQDHLEFAVIVGGFAIGPVFHNKIATAQELFYKMMDRKRMPMLPEVLLHFCDAGDLAEATFNALLADKAAGARLVLSPWCLWAKEIAEILHQEFKDQGYKIPQTTAPYAVLWVASAVDKSLRNVLRFCNKEFTFDSSKALSVLNISPRDPKKSIIDSVYSYIEKGILHKTKQYRGQKESST